MSYKERLENIVVESEKMMNECALYLEERRQARLVLDDELEERYNAFLAIRDELHSIYSIYDALNEKTRQKIDYLLCRTRSWEPDWAASPTDQQRKLEELFWKYPE